MKRTIAAFLIFSTLGGVRLASTAETTKRVPSSKQGRSGHKYSVIVSQEGIGYPVTGFFGKDFFQSQYGSDDTFSGKRYDDPDELDALVTTGYLKEILDRLETEIDSLRIENRDQKEQIQEMQLQIAWKDPFK